MAMLMGCSLKRSALAARRNSSAVANESSRTSSATVGFPMVSVPVLSKATVWVCPTISANSPPLTRISRRAACPMLATIAVGVASTSAQGQKTMRTVMPRTTLPVRPHTTAARSKAAGTYHFADLIGDALHRGLRGLSLFDQPADTGEGGIVADCSCFHLQMPD